MPVIFATAYQAIEPATAAPAPNAAARKNARALLDSDNRVAMR